MANCKPVSTRRMRRPATEPAKPPFTVSEALNEVMYHAGYNDETNAMATVITSTSASAGRLSDMAREQVTYSAMKLSCTTTIRYKVSSSEHKTIPTDSKRKFQRRAAVEAPKTLQMFTARIRTGIRAKKKLTKLMNAIPTISIAIPNSTAEPLFEPCSTPPNSNASQ